MRRCKYSNKRQFSGLEYSNTKKSFQINYRLENSRNLVTQAAVYSDFCLHSRCNIREHYECVGMFSMRLSEVLRSIFSYTLWMPLSKQFLRCYCFLFVLAYHIGECVFKRTKFQMYTSRVFPRIQKQSLIKT